VIKIIKKLVNAMTISRILCAFLLLFLAPASINEISVLFYVVYSWCVLSDFIDGPIARKTKSTSEFGSFLDSAADMILAIIVLIIFLPILDLAPWMAALVVIVLATRAVGFTIGFVKWRTFTLLHTYANKAAGAMLGFFPIFLGLFGLAATVIILFTAAILSAAEELVITIRSKDLQRNITSMFALNKEKIA